jgi:hypothetical protein
MTTTLNTLIHDFMGSYLGIVKIKSQSTNLLNLTGHPINVETTNGVYVIGVAKDRYGQTWSLKVNQVATDKYCDIDLGGGKVAIHSRSEDNGDLVLWCKETKEEVIVPFDSPYRFPSAFDGVTLIVSAMTGNRFASNTVLMPMTAPHENPTRNEKGWIVSVKGLRFN